LLQGKIYINAIIHIKAELLTLNILNKKEAIYYLDKKEIIYKYIIFILTITEVQLE